MDMKHSKYLIYLIYQQKSTQRNAKQKTCTLIEHVESITRPLHSQHDQIKIPLKDVLVDMLFLLFCSFYGSNLPACRRKNEKQGNSLIVLHPVQDFFTEMFKDCR
jgi:hypothetical protein